MQAPRVEPQSESEGLLSRPNARLSIVLIRSSGVHCDAARYGVHVTLKLGCRGHSGV